jgi:DUF971 family protein
MHLKTGLDFTVREDINDGFEKGLYDWSNKYSIS